MGLSQNAAYIQYMDKIYLAKMTCIVYSGYFATALVPSARNL